MALMQTEQLTPTSAIALWNIEESIEELKDQLDLNLEDANELDCILHEGKQRDWLAGRITMKAVTDFFGVKYEGLKKDVNGKPYLVNSPAHVSLSHSYRYVACIIDTQQAVGVDIELIKHKIDTMKHRFLSEEELAKVGTNVKTITEYWCGKEVLYKIYGRRGITFSKDFFIEKINSSELIGYIKTEELEVEHKIQIEKIDNHIIAYNIT